MHWARRAGLFVWSLLLSGCSKSAPAEAPPLPHLFQGHPGASALRVESRDDAPTLQSIARSGDPASAVSFALHTSGSRETLALLGLLDARLRAPRYEALTVHNLGLTMTRWVTNAEEAQAFFEGIRLALGREVGKNDPAISVASKLLESARVRSSERSPVDECLGRLGSDAPEFGATSAEELEGFRVRVGALRVGLGALGEPSVLAAANEFQGRSWPRGEPPSLPSQDADRWIIRAGPARTVRVAVRTPRVSEALATARAMQDPEHPIRARVESLGGRFRYQNAHVATQPGGACLGVELVQADGGGRVQAESLARVVLAVQDEIRLALDGTAAAEELALSILSPENALEAVTLAAWTATGAPPRVGEVWLGEARLPAPESVPDAEFTSVLERVAATQTGAIPLARRAEPGQPESWLLVGSPCGFGPESSEEAGFRAAALESVALAFSGREGVTLEPWYSQEGVGLMGHARRLRGESARAHALRLARRLALALKGGALDGQVVARARAELLAAVGENPARKLALSVLGGDHPSMLDGRGRGETLSRLSTLDVEQARAAIAAEPLRAAFLDSSRVDQSGAVHEGLDSWFRLDLGVPVPCPKASPAAARPGLWQLRSVSEGLVSERYIGVPSRGPLEAGLALEFLLGRQGGYLDRALLGSPFAAKFAVSYLGGSQGGALLIRLSGEPAILDQALQQTRAVLEDLAQRGVPPADVELVHAKQEKEERERSMTPRGRVLSLWLGRGKGAPRVEGLGDGLAALKASEHRLIALDVRD